MENLRKNIERHLNELCLRCNSRHVGSVGEKRAADYIESVFREYGLPVVREEYPVRGWEFDSMEFYDMTKGCAVPLATPCFFSNSVEIEGKLLVIGDDEFQNLPNVPVAGRICFVLAFNGVSNVFGRNKIAEELDKYGAAAAIFISDYHTDLAPSTKIQRSPFLKHLGTAAVAAEGALFLAQNKEDNYRIRISARNFDTQSANVIARYGSGPKCTFGAHYDTAPLIQGASDNATGTVMLMEMARLLKGKRPDLQLDFAAFSAEEYIPDTLCPGSGDYIRRHKDENIRWYMNFDDFGILIGKMVVQIGHQELLPNLKPATLPFVKATQSSDDKGFYLAGIPTIGYSEEKPFQFLHTIKDTLDYLDLNKIVFGIKDACKLFEQL